MSATQNRRYNEGLERGRKAQLSPGYAPPPGIYSLPEAERDAYLNGWQKGYDSTIRIELLRLPV